MKKNKKQTKNYIIDNMLDDSMDTPSPDDGLIIIGTNASWYPQKYFEKNHEKEIDDLINSIKIK